MTMAERIDSILVGKKMSRRQLALKAGIPPSSLQSAMERNRTLSIEMQEKIAKALELPVYEILGDAEQYLYVEAEVGSVQRYINAGYRFSSEEQLLILLFNQLNPSGKQEAINRIGELAYVPHYNCNGISGIEGIEPILPTSDIIHSSLLAHRIPLSSTSEDQDISPEGNAPTSKPTEGPQEGE